MTFIAIFLFLFSIRFHCYTNNTKDLTHAWPSCKEGTKLITKVQPLLSFNKKVLEEHNPWPNTDNPCIAEASEWLLYKSSCGIMILLPIIDLNVCGIKPCTSSTSGSRAIALFLKGNENRIKETPFSIGKKITILSQIWHVRSPVCSFLISQKLIQKLNYGSDQTSL